MVFPHVTKRFFVQTILPTVVVLGLFVLWTLLGVHNFALNADISRDLNELSNLWIGRVVWLGPLLRVGFPASPIYFYLLFPGLWLSNGSANSLIVTQAVIGAVGLMMWSILNQEENGLGHYLQLLFIGLSSWWLLSVTHPWNGYMYVLWVVMSLICLWHRQKLWLAVLLFGIAVAIHPAALLVAPIILYEWYVFPAVSWWKKLVYLVGGLTLPWAPIIAFELITKGYLVRQWWQHKDTGFSWQFNVTNTDSLVRLIGLPHLLFLILLATSLVIGSTKSRMWLLLLVPTLLFLLTTSALHQYYLLGVAAAVCFIFAQSLTKNVIGKALLALAIFVFTMGALRTYSFNFNQPPRSRLTNISSVVTTLIESGELSQAHSYAVISVIDDQNSTPQADDYRFLLRAKGFTAPPIAEYSQADYLLVFFENGQTYPEQWRDWHTDQFGAKKLQHVKKIGDVQVVTYQRN